MKIMTKFTQLEIETNDRYRSFRLDTDIQFETNIYRLTLVLSIWMQFDRFFVDLKNLNSWQRRKGTSGLTEV